MDNPQLVVMGRKNEKRMKARGIQNWHTKSVCERKTKQMTRSGETLVRKGSETWGSLCIVVLRKSDKEKKERKRLNVK